MELMTSADLMKTYRISKSALHRWVESGKIPKPITGWIGSERRWLKADIDRHIESMISGAMKEEAR